MLNSNVQFTFTKYLIATHISKLCSMLYVSAVIIIALALLSPLPFISPFDYIIQDATAQNIPPGTSSFEIIPNLIVSPFGVIENGVNGFNSIVNPIQINTFQIGDSIYAGVYTSSNSGVFTIINITVQVLQS